ncbi:hypothetical protein DRP04_10085 [Archaeoglobales archaeon]|nr:MAG: hypothetical protein DRP04_10085 [Archaeoglobales archaeon]
MNELAIAFLIGIMLGFLIKMFVKSFTGFMAATCLIAAISGILAGKSEITIIGTLSLFGIAALKNGRRGKNAR